jgi:hypothetical protein
MTIDMCEGTALLLVKSAVLEFHIVAGTKMAGRK